MANLLAPDWHSEFSDLRIVRTGKPLPSIQPSLPAAVRASEPSLRHILRFRDIESSLDVQRRYNQRGPSR